MILYSGAAAPPLHMGPPTCEERADARRLAREEFVYPDPADREIARGGTQGLGTARERAETAIESEAIDTDAGGRRLAASPSGPVYTPAESVTPFLAQLIAQETYPDDLSPMMRRAAEASEFYGAAPTSRVSYDGPQVRFDVTA